MIEFPARGYTSFHRVRKRYRYTHSRNARETQHGRPAQDESESEFLTGVHTITAARSLSPFLFSSLLLSLCFYPPSPAVFQSVHTCASSSFLLYVHIQTRRNLSSFLHNVVALVASLSRFLAFYSTLFPRSSFLRLSTSLRFAHTLHSSHVFLTLPCGLAGFSFAPFLSRFLHLSFVLVP